MKVAKACTQCRNGKRRCERHDGPLGLQSSCKQCRQRQLKCSYSLRKGPATRMIAPEQAPIDKLYPEALSDVRHRRTLSDVSTEVIDELVDHYLRFIHDRPHSLFHGPTLRNDIKYRSVSQALLCALCALGSRFSKSEQTRSLGQDLAAEAKQLFQADLMIASLENVQTCVLAGNICAADLDFETEGLYFGLAIRMAQILGLHKTNPEDSFVRRETKARVWWTLFMADRWGSAGLGLPRQIDASTRTVELPTDEYVFQRLASNERPKGYHGVKSGLWAYMITLVEIFGPVQDLNRRLLEEDVREEESDGVVSALSKQLDVWEQSLPAHLELNDKNLEQHRDRGLGGSFVALHLGYHHYATLLYFHYLDPIRPSGAKRDIYVGRCKFHATSYSSLLKTSRDRKGCEAVYATVGHMALVSSAVLLHTLLFGNDHELPKARESLTHNFEALIELKRLWPSLERTLYRLFVFQNSCLSAVDAHTHKIDRWMIRFLIEHALPLDEKMPNPGPSPTPAALVALLEDVNQKSAWGHACSAELAL